MIDSSSYYKIYKERIEKAIKNNDAKLLEDVKQAVMWAPSTKLLPSESGELWKMIKSATFKDGTSTLNDAVYSINIYSSNPDKLSSFCNTYLSTCKNAKDQGKGRHPVYGGYVNIGGLSSADVLHLKEMAKSWASISIHLNSKVGDCAMDLRVGDGIMDAVRFKNGDAYGVSNRVGISNIEQKANELGGRYAGNDRAWVKFLIPDIKKLGLFVNFLSEQGIRYDYRGGNSNYVHINRASVDLEDSVFDAKYSGSPKYVAGDVVKRDGETLTIIKSAIKSGHINYYAKSSKDGFEAWVGPLDDNHTFDMKSVADGNLAYKPLKVGQTVHLDPSNISQGKLTEEELKADYVVEHFYYEQRPVKEDPTINMPEYLRTFSGVGVKNKKTGKSFDVNRMQLMDGQTNIIPIVGQRYRMPNLFNSTFVVTSVSNNSVTMKADKTGMTKTWDINMFESGVRQGQIIKDSKISYEDGDTSDIDKMDKYALAYKLEKYGIKVNESNPKPVAEMRRLLKEKMSQKDSKMFKVTDKNTGVVRLARAADGLDAVRKVSAVKDSEESKIKALFNMHRVAISNKQISWLIKEGYTAEDIIDFGDVFNFAVNMIPSDSEIKDSAFKDALSAIKDDKYSSEISKFRHLVQEAEHAVNWFNGCKTDGGRSDAINSLYKIVEGKTGLLRWDTFRIDGDRPFGKANLGYELWLERGQIKGTIALHSKNWDDIIDTAVFR